MGDGTIALNLDTAALHAAATADRTALHRLDACLHPLEDAHERGERRVSPRLGRRLHPNLHWVRVGMPLGEAIERTFGEQEWYLHGDRLELLPVPPDLVPAIALTDWHHQSMTEFAQQYHARRSISPVS